MDPGTIDTVQVQRLLICDLQWKIRPDPLRIAEIIERAYFIPCEWSAVSPRLQSPNCGVNILHYISKQCIKLSDIVDPKSEHHISLDFHS